MKTLEGKVAVITGGSSGIGLATAKRFVDEGAHVAITGRREKELKEGAAFIKRNVTTVVGDAARVENRDQPYAVVKGERCRPVGFTDPNGSQGQARGNRGCRHVPRLR